uniref:Uncharacterized protein n=1 Tax=Arundo donax TaxID=35708 RepID=A0A0A9HKL2_ARUDO
MISVVWQNLSLSVEDTC